MERLGRAAGTIAMLAVSLAAMAGAEPAAAYLRAFESPADTFPAPSSLSPKSLTPSCGGSKIALGVGASSEPLTQLGISDLGGAPLAQSQGFSTTQELDPTDGVWSATTTVRCMENTAEAPYPSIGAGYAKAISVQTSTSGLNSKPKSRSAVCPAGHTAIAGGGSIKVMGGDNPGVAFSQLHPSQDDRWTAAAAESDRVRADWKLTARAVCANVTTYTETPDYVGAGGIYTFDDTAIDSAAVKSASISCGPDLRVVGGGARVYTELGPGSVPAEVAITRSQPAGVGGGAARRWVASARELDPTEVAWGLRATTICMPLNHFPD